MPANGGHLRIGYRSPGSKIGRCGSEIADSLRRMFEIFPFLGDGGWRPRSICNAWPVGQCYLLWSPTILAKNREFSIVHCVTDAAVQLVVYCDMADGQVVLVTTEPLGGGSPVRSVYFVAEEDPEKAKAIIGAMMAPNEKVEAWGRLPEAAVKALGLKPGDFKHG
jgi:hypothetical protein